VGWLRYADPVAALAVSGIILRFAWGLARRTTFELLDTAPEGASERMARAAEAVAGVLAVERVRVRRAGSRTFAELRVAVPRFDTAEHIEGIVERVGAAVRSVAPDADVTIRAVPRQAPGESVFDHIRGVAARSNVTLHDLIIQQQAGGGLRVEQHIELPESLPLVEAHRFVRELEDRMYRAAPDVTSILTHIESTPSTIESAPPPEPDCGLEEELRRIASELPEVLDIHEVAVSRVGDHLRLSCHCTLPDTMPMSRVHEVITELEDRLKLERPEVDRMLVHPEPQADNRHEHRHRTPATISETTEHTHERERRVAERAAVHGPVRERPYADL
jgi:divalent metal cation (Fe/Co/Zn/Cd) transporter